MNQYILLELYNITVLIHASCTEKNNCTEKIIFTQQLLFNFTNSYYLCNIIFPEHLSCFKDVKLFLEKNTDKENNNILYWALT